MLALLKAGQLVDPDKASSAPSTPTTPSTPSTPSTSSYYDACSSSSTTLYEGMEDIGVNLDWNLQCEIAEANGITDFSGTAEQSNTELPVDEEPTWPEVEFDWEPAAPSGSFDPTEPTTEEPAPEQTGAENAGSTDNSGETTEESTEEETSPAERDGVTGNYTPWG